MSQGQIKNFMNLFWVQREDNIYLVGLNEDAIETFEEIKSIDLPQENEIVDTDIVIGSIQTDNETIDLYAPVSGTIVEINSLVLEDSTLIQEDPYDSWLFKIESEEDDEDEDDDDLDEDDEDEEDEDFDEDDDK